MFPITLQGALKLKEISYMHSEGCPDAEMKNGAIALVSGKGPCFFRATHEHIMQKNVANIQQVFKGNCRCDRWQ
jgi:glucosamine--fructose-6-phosphate aminotransferase (isomerizing)